MNKKIVVAFTAFLIVAMMLTPLALARPWNPKNNEKFLDYDVVIGFNWAETVFNIELVPSPDRPNKLIMSWDEVATVDYTITVEGIGTYVCGTDFEYSGVAVYTTIGAPYETDPDTGFPVGTKEVKFRVDFMYDFGDDGEGIDGTLEMLAITAQEGVMHISSQRGTGDLQNVKVFATAAGAGHDGMVIGWPDIPPETP